MKLEGNIISGEFHPLMNEFSIQSVKQFATSSTLNQNQFKSLYEYLKKHKHEVDGQVLTLYDQMPVRLSQDDVNQLIDDLDQIKSMYYTC